MAKTIDGVKYNTHQDILEMSGLTPLEISEIKLNTQIVGALIEAREKAKLTQKDLGKITNIHQPTIAKIENGRVDPQLTTILRLLEPLGKTLAVVPK